MLYSGYILSLLYYCYQNYPGRKSGYYFIFWRNRVEKLFVLGRPGSGKSTAARHIAALATEAGWHVDRLNDYRILQDMALHQPWLFHRRSDGGFDARDYSMLKDALIHIRYAIDEKEAAAEQDASVANKKLLIVEFARDKYEEAIEDIMRPVFTNNSHILFIHASIDACLERIHERTMHPHYEDDHPSCSDELFIRYYGTDDREFIQMLQERYGFERCIEIVESNGTLDHFKQRISSFWERILCNSAGGLVPLL
jgi:shikimate kinase